MTLLQDSPGHGGGPVEPPLIRYSAQASATRPTWRRRAGTGLRKRLLSEGGIVGVLCLMIYVTIAWLLEMKYDVFGNDSVSRMANAYYVLYARDPHLAAIGFVWNPLPSVSVMPLLLLKNVWFPLASHDMAGALTSAICMTGAVHQLRSTFREWGLARITRLTIVALFALNPMILYYSGNGMSEALYLFTILAITRYLSRWLVTDQLSSLVYAAAALGLAYLARNEAVAPAIFSGLLVIGVGIYRRPLALTDRTMAALTDGTIYLLPFVICFLGWATISWVITGAPFAQFSSIYGTGSEITALGVKKSTYAVALHLEVRDILYMAPLLAVIVVIALAIAAKRRSLLVLVPIAVIATSLGFDMVAYATGSILSSFRYFINAIPLEALLVGSFFATASTARVARGYQQSPTAHRPTPVATTTKRSFWITVPGVLIALIVALAFLGPSIPSTGAGMFNPRVGYDETDNLGYIFHKHLTPTDRVFKAHYDQVLKIGSYITAMHLPDGSVVADTFGNCVPEVITTIPNPRVFVITNDRDFQKILADPPQFKARYLLLVDPAASQGGLNALNRAYPNLYKTGQTDSTSFTAHLVHSFAARGNCEAFRLYHLNSSFSPAQTPQ